MKNKIMPSGVQLAFFMISLTIVPIIAVSQALPRSSYGLPIVNSISLFGQTTRQRPGYSASKSLKTGYGKPWVHCPLYGMVAFQLAKSGKL